MNTLKTTPQGIFVCWNAVPAMPGDFRCRNSVPAYRFPTQAQKMSGGVVANKSILHKNTIVRTSTIARKRPNNVAFASSYASVPFRRLRRVLNNSTTSLSFMKPISTNCVDTKRFTSW